MLPSAFEGYMKKCKEPSWDQALREAIYWYAQSNTASGANESLILAQTALELLSWHYFVIDEGMTKNRYKAIYKNADSKIRELLNRCQIPQDIPVSCIKLKNLNLKSADDSNRLCDAPETITRLRNQIVHPKPDRIASEAAYMEARKLALAHDLRQGRNESSLNR